MAISTAVTSYKKQYGILMFDNTRQSVTWSPMVSAESVPLSIAVANITNLQQTPASIAKCALRIMVQPSTAAIAENHVFYFTSATAARSEHGSVTDALRNAIIAIKVEDKGGQESIEEVANLLDTVQDVRDNGVKPNPKFESVV